MNVHHESFPRSKSSIRGQSGDLRLTEHPVCARVREGGGGNSSDPSISSSNERISDSRNVSSRFAALPRGKQFETINCTGDRSKKTNPLSHQRGGGEGGGRERKFF